MPAQSSHPRLRPATPSVEPPSFAPMSSLAICVAGATGWAGRAIVEAVAAADDLELRSAVSRSAAGGEIHGAPVRAAVVDALDGVDVLIDYTSHDVVREHALAAIDRGAAVVIGTSGLTADDYLEIDAAARRRDVGVVAAGNFSITAAMAQAAALLAARHLPSWEVIDYASAGKTDAPSGTSRELAERLEEVRRPELGVPLDDVHGAPEARGATVAGTQVHSLRLPSFVVSTEVVFAADGERLSIRHDAGETPAPYVAGTLLAIRAVGSRVGLTRGLDRLLD
jgi:4-hydroxy-tetrahydrodipicolinate reductase